MTAIGIRLNTAFNHALLLAAIVVQLIPARWNTQAKSFGFVDKFHARSNMIEKTLKLTSTLASYPHCSWLTSPSHVSSHNSVYGRARIMAGGQTIRCAWVFPDSIAQ